MESVLSIGDVRRASQLLDDQRPQAPPLDVDELRGRWTELTGGPGHPQVTLAAERLAAIHHAGEPAAWIGPTTSLFYPPDLAGWNPDWSALALIRVDEAHPAARAADKLLRSGAFGLVVLDLTGVDASQVPSPLAGRLSGLAEQHDTAALLLTRRTADEAVSALSPLASLRVRLWWAQTGADRLRMEATVTKDKRRGPGHELQEVYDGPLGLC